MDIRVKGGQVLSGEILPSGSKNSAVHLIPTTILFNKKVIFENIPDITDVERLVNILIKLESRVNWDKKKSRLEIDNSNISFKKLTQKDLGDMKGTSLLWGALLARFKKVDFTKLPGGCTLGARTLKPIYNALSKLGAEVKEVGEGVKMSLKNKKTSELWLTEMSPTATTNSILLAVGKKGTTKIIGAASEPQVQDVCNFLVSAGAEIAGIGTSVLLIKGGNALSVITYKILSDHYEIATFLALGAATGGEIRVKNAIPEYFTIINQEFNKFNIKINYKKDTAIVKGRQNVKLKNEGGRTTVVRAQPWPSLPVDLLPIFVPLALSAPRGQVLFHNWMYEAGLFWTSELNKLGAEVIMCDPHRVIVIGGHKLTGATLEAPFIIRATVSLVMSAMISTGESVIQNADTLYRGHPYFSDNLQKLGAKIEEIK
jgi:UDP-N-acetylglucosamine 1-carboxyvinyltransferase